MPRPDRLGYLQKKGHQTFALHINYETEPNTFDILKQYAIENSVNYIVGSSAGGYIGYWLGHELKIPQLLLNPAVAMRNIEADLGRSIPIQPAVKSWIALGLQDEIIPREPTLNFFKPKPNHEIITCHWLGHEIDFDSFKSIVNWSGL